MPITSAVNHKSKQPIPTLLDQEKRLLPEVIAILEIMQTNETVLGTGYISLEEIYTLTAQAIQSDVKVTITHPLHTGFGCTLNLEKQLELASMGAFIEHSFVACMPILGGMSPKVMVDHIKAVGEEHCILSTDFGQTIHPSLPEGFRMMIGTMLEFSLSEREIEHLIKINPARIMGLAEIERS
jgi:hypothetical protein